MFSLFKKKQLKNTSKKGLNTSSGFPTFFPNSISPDFLNLNTGYSLVNTFYNNPVVNAVISIKANAFSNMRYKIKDLKTGEIIDLKDYKDDNLKLILTRPNALQTSKEYLKTYKIHEAVFGNTYTYASVRSGYEKNFDGINVLNLLPPYLVEPCFTGSWLETRDIKDVIKHYEFKDVLKADNIKYIDPELVLHLNEPNIKYDSNFAKGKSKLISLSKPISNIDKALESRNVMIKRRGATGFLTSDKGDAALGTIPLTPEEREEAQNDYRKYGLLDDQYSLMILNQPMKFQKMGLNVKELMLFEEVESSAIAISHAFGVPELLTKQYIHGGTYDNIKVSQSALYSSTIIPESEVYIQGLNSFLNTKDKGIEILGSFDHVEVLQKNKLEESEVKRNNQNTALNAFLIGAITYNQYLQSIDMPNDDEIGDLRIWNLDQDQRNAIGLSKPNKNDTTT